jgi:hypothetical protein
MPAAATDAQTPALVAGAHRVIRTIESLEGPFAGVLVTRGDAVAVRVDAAALAGWDGWRFGGSEHVVGPLDIVRRAQGHDALLPWCTQRVSTFVGGRTAAGEGLSPGECNTLLVSLFRALGELGREDAVVGATGSWWLTDDGRPVFVLGEGDEARRGVAMLVTQLGESCSDKTLGRLLGVVDEGLRANLEQQRRVPPLLLERWEREALEVAAPRALRREQVTADGVESVVRTAPRRETSSPALSPSPSARDSPAMPGRRAAQGRRRRQVRRRAQGRVQGQGAQRGERADRGERGVPKPSVVALGASVVMRLRDQVWSLRARFDRRLHEGRTARRRSALRPRRRSLLVAAGVAIVVLLVGLLWPSGATSEVADGAEGTVGASPEAAAAPGSDRTGTGESAAAGASGGEAEATPSLRPSPSAAASRATEAAGDPADVAAWLLKEIAKCADTGDTVCAEAVADGSSDVIAALVGDGTGAEVEADTANVELVDEYGDAAVVRLTPQQTGKPGTAREAGTEAGRILVLVRIDEKWLVRDVYDVADQPE